MTYQLRGPLSLEQGPCQRSTQGRPEIQQDVFAAIIGELDRFVGKRLDLEIGGLFPDCDRGNHAFQNKLPDVDGFREIASFRDLDRHLTGGHGILEVKLPL